MRNFVSSHLANKIGMYNFFKKKLEFVLIGLAILFLGILVGALGWGIGSLIGSLNNAINVGAGAGEVAVTFDLDGARSLNLKSVLR